MLWRRSVLLLTFPLALSVVAACAAEALSFAEYAGAKDSSVNVDGGVAGESAFSRVNSLCESSPSARAVCDPDTRASCSADAAGQGCVVRFETSKCAAVGPLGEGEVCAEGGSCGAGLACVQDRAAAFRCRRYCCSRSCAASGSYCALAREIALQGDAGTGAMLPVCLPADDCAADAGGCRSGSACTPVGIGLRACVSTGPRQPGESCARAGCVEGAACVGSGGERTCLKMCSVSAPRCERGELCVHFTLTVKDPDLGYCIDPNVERPRAD